MSCITAVMVVVPPSSMCFLNSQRLLEVPEAKAGLEAAHTPRETDTTANKCLRLIALAPMQKATVPGVAPQA